MHVANYYKISCSAVEILVSVLVFDSELIYFGYKLPLLTIVFPVCA